MLRRNNNELRWWATFGLGVIVLAGFAWLVIYMTGQVDAQQAVWDRVVYLFGSIEAIVFVVVGAIFGVTVQKKRVDAAESKAESYMESVVVAGRALAEAVFAHKGSMPQEVVTLAGKVC